MIRFALLPFLAFEAHAETLTRRVVAVADGDTAVVAHDWMTRLPAEVLRQ